MADHICPCGAKLWTYDELMEGDPLNRAFAKQYLAPDFDGFCFDEDEVVPLGYAAEIIRRRQHPPGPCDCDPLWGCDKCCVPLDFPLAPALPSKDEPA